MPDSTRFSGSIPVLIDLLAVIKEIELSDIAVAGLIPTKVGLLTALEALVSRNNQLSGSIPSTIGGLRALVWVYLDHNRLVVTASTEMGLLTSLDTLVLYENTITGSTPALVCELTRRWMNCNEIFCDCCVRNIAYTPSPLWVGWTNLFSIQSISESCRCGHDILLAVSVFRKELAFE